MFSPADHLLARHEYSLFDNIPGFCETRLDVVESDYVQSALFAGRTKSKNLDKSNADDTCRAEEVPYLSKVQPDRTIHWLKYFTSGWESKFTAVKLSPDEAYTEFNTYTTYLTALLKSNLLGTMMH